MRQRHAVFLGLSGFPLGMAAIQRQKLVGRMLVSEGWRVTVVCSRSVHSQDSDVLKNGIYDGINYHYLYQPERAKNFVLRNLQKLFSPLLEFKLLFKYKIQYGIDASIVSNRNYFFPAVKYFIFSRILSFHHSLNLVEIYKNRDDRSILYKLNDEMFNRWGLFFFDSYLPISEYIINQFSDSAKPYLFIPIIVDIDKINKATEEICLEKNYFVYCGSATYSNAIRFIVDAFARIKMIDCLLVIVTNGSKDELKSINDYICSTGLQDQIIILKDLTDSYLYSLYKKANALLLPLFNTIQDQARFPHKLAEYLATGSIVIANPIGQVTKYLRHGESILFSEADNPQSFADNMAWVLANPEKTKMIGNQGKEVCHNNFNYLQYSKPLVDFFIHHQ